MMNLHSHFSPCFSCNLLLNLISFDESDGQHLGSGAKVFTGFPPEQDRADGRFCEKSSSFPTGERISRKILHRLSPFFQGS